MGLSYFLSFLVTIFFKNIVILIILQQVSGTRFSRNQLVLYSFFPTISIVEFFLFFFLIYKLDNYKHKLLSIFYVVYALSVEALFTRFILFYLLPILPQYSITLFETDIFYIALELLLIPFHYVFVKVIRIDYGKLKHLNNNLLYRLVLPLNIVMGFYYVLVNILIISESFNLVSDTLYFRKSITILYCLIFLTLMLTINYTMTEELDKEVQFLKDQQLASLSSYSKHVEALYREIRSFRHDYTNILVSLNESIRKGNIKQIRQVYDTVIADSDKKFYDRKYDIATLANVKDDAIKSILSAKLIEAQKQGISISVEVEHEVSLKQIELLDFITILSIFLDNAIEAARLSANPEILVAYFEEKNQLIFFIENSTKDSKVNTNRIFDYGYSTKGEDRGIGLNNVSQIIKRCSNLSLVTGSKDYRFSQMLKIEYRR